jgi:hypothetical protein
MLNIVVIVSSGINNKSFCIMNMFIGGTELFLIIIGLPIFLFVIPMLITMGIRIGKKLIKIKES